MRYAKLENGFPQYAPRKLRVGDAVVYNPIPEQLFNAGYLPVIETTPPEAEDGYYATPHWAEVDGEIVQSWEIVEIPVSDELDPAEALDIILGGGEA